MSAISIVSSATNRAAHRSARLSVVRSDHEASQVSLSPCADNSAQRLRLTQRGRLFLVGLPVLVVTAVAVMTLLVLIAPATVAASTDSVSGSGTEVVTVSAGQSLWDVAYAADPDRDTRAVIAEIMELNDLTSQSVEAGQQLEVPGA